MHRPILITGAGGPLGQAVVRHLQAAGYTTRCGTRNPDRCRAVGGEVVRFDWSNSLSYRPALDGAGQVVVIPRSLDIMAAVVVPELIDECRAVGVEHVVFVSSLGADKQLVGPLGLAERVLRNSGLAWTILRPNFFMENFSHGWLRPEIQSAGRIEVPAGSGRTSFVSMEDVAAVVAAVVAADQPRGQVHDLTGDDPMSHTAVAAALTRASGRPVNYDAVNPDQVRERARRGGLPAGQLEYLLALYALVREGQAARVTSTVSDLLGRKPRRFDDFAADNADAWRVVLATGP
jgi:uncharacterized protein YbjT (DUF2867 family)